MSDTQYPTVEELDVLATIAQYESRQIEVGEPLYSAGRYYLVGVTGIDDDNNIRSLIEKGYLVRTNFEYSTNPPMRLLVLTDNGKQFLREGAKL